MNNEQPNNVILRTEDNKVWYSEAYLIKQIENAYKNGLSSGQRLKIINYIEPSSIEQVNECVKIFKEKIEEQFNKDYINGYVIKYK